MTNQFKKVGSITVFFLIAISLRYYIDVVKPNFLSNLHLYLQILLLGVGPFIGGLVVVKFFKRPNYLKLFSINFWKTITAVAIPMVLFALVGVIENGTPSINLFKIIGIIILYALLEEYGWRGYLHSELGDMKKIYKYLIITILWFVWHLNLEFSISNLIFFMALLAGSYGIGYVANRSKSLVLSALFHSFMNMAQTPLLGEVNMNYKLIIIAISAVVAILIIKSSAKKTTVELKEVL